jgi:membrane protease subunit HflK
MSLMPWDNGGGRKRTETPARPKIEDLFRGRRDKLRQAIGSGLPGSIAFLVATVLAAIVGYYAFSFRVNPDELGVVMRFGKVTRQEPPGLHFRMPYPIDEVRLPKVTQQNIIEIGAHGHQHARRRHCRQLCRRGEPDAERR